MLSARAGKNEKGERIPLDVRVGDRVLFGKYSGNEIKIDDVDYVVVKEDQIMLRLGKTAKAATSKR